MVHGILNMFSSAKIPFEYSALPKASYLMFKDMIATLRLSIFVSSAVIYILQDAFRADGTYVNSYCFFFLR